MVGRERIPSTGPVLLVGNHPNDLPDVLLGFLSTPRPVRYVATAAAATSIAVRWMYEGLGVIPVTRVKDARKLRQRGKDMAAANRVAFDRVTHALKADHVVGVYPEGGVYDGPGVGPMRSGVARLALDGSMTGAISGLQVVPIGLQYEMGYEPGSDVLALVGRPMSLDDWLRTAPERPNVAFTIELRRLIEGVSRTAVTVHEAEERERVLAAAGACLAEAGEAPIVAAGRVGKAWTFLQTDPTATAAVATIGATAERAGGRAVSARDCRRVIDAARGGRKPGVLRLAALAPLALPGLAIHGPVFALIWWLSKRISRLRSDRAARAIVPGLYLMFVWYAILAMTLVLGVKATAWGAAWPLPLVLLAVAAVVLVLPRLGDLAVGWRHELRAFRLHRRVRRWQESERAAIRASADALRAAWTSHLKDSAVTASGTVLA